MCPCLPNVSKPIAVAAVENTCRNTKQTPAQAHQHYNTHILLQIDGNSCIYSLSQTDHSSSYNQPPRTKFYSGNQQQHAILQQHAALLSRTAMLPAATKFGLQRMLTQ
jgi:hypothetical protein